MNNDISHNARHEQQIQQHERQLGVAAEPANTVRNAPVCDGYPSEHLIKLVPRIDVVMGATLNTVNEVIEQHRTVSIDGVEHSLHKPLSRAATGVAVEALEQLFTYVGSLGMSDYVLFCNHNEQKQRIQSFVDLLQTHLVQSFGGEAFEHETGEEEFAIARGDYFNATVRIGDVVRGTVNTVYLDVRVIVHAASLTNGPADPADAVKAFNTAYRSVVRNMANASGIESRVHVAFDVSNFTVRPQILGLFTALCSDERTQVAAVNPTEYKGANVLVSVPLTKAK